MPYMMIYKTEDGKWRNYSCQCIKDGYVDAMKIGSTSNNPDPSKEDLCRECFACLFKTDNDLT